MVNLLPAAYRRRKLRRQLLAFGLVMLMISLVASSLSCFFLWRMIARGEGEAAQVQDRLEDASRLGEDNERLRQEITALEERLKLYRGWSRSNDAWGELLKALANLLPDAVWLESIEATEGKGLMIRGGSGGSHQVTSYIRNLQGQEGLFAGVELSELRRGHDEKGVGFQLKLTLNDAGPLQIAGREEGSR